MSKLLPPTKQEKLAYTSRVILNSMTIIEDLLIDEAMFHERYPLLQKQYEEACESGKLSDMHAVKAYTDALIDALRSK